MVPKWEAGGPEIRPRPLNQAALDTSLGQAGPEIQHRFAILTAGPRTGASGGTHPARPVRSRRTGHPLRPCRSPSRTRPGHLVRHPIDGKLMTLVGAGPFHAGSGQTVWLPAFYIDVHPTTNADYARFLTATGPPAADWPEVLEPMAANAVVEPSFDDACAYAFWASKSLPTGAQWDRAAMGVEGMIVGNIWEWCRTEAGPRRHGRKRAAQGGFRCTTPAPELLALLSI
jgi:Sulfatase-modifying factor enzyme 1